MRLLLPLTLFVASVAAVDNFQDFFISLVGDCAGKCMATAYEEVSNCGDPSKSSSNACYCKMTQSQVDSVDTTSAASCISKCTDVDTSAFSDSNSLYNELLQDQKDLCSGTTTSTKTNSALPNTRGGLAGVGLGVGASVAYLFL